MRTLKISCGESRRARNWTNLEISWEGLVERLSRTIRTKETVAEYRSLEKAVQDDIKDVGGFVGGHLKDGRRLGDHVLCRSFLALDMDFGTPEAVERLRELPYACCFYSTHKHTPEAPRLRLIVPLSRDVTADEYGAIARRTAADIDMELFDDSTYQAHRLMYWPSTSSDGEFLFHEVTGGPLDADACLARYGDWRDVSRWPVSSRVRASHPAPQTTPALAPSHAAADPLMKKGIVGAYCRAHSIRNVLETELSNVYRPSHTPGRYDLIGGESTAGGVVYEDKFFYSFHATDPVCGRLLNAFDLVRLHKFPNSDEKASFRAMCDYASRDTSVQQLTAEEAADWHHGLECGEGGIVKNTLQNLRLILENDEALANIKRNTLTDLIEITGKLPWEAGSKYWDEYDDAHLISYIDKTYGSFSLASYPIALNDIVDRRSFHPIRDYFAQLPPWDGTPRAERLLIDYLGAEDSAYTRAVTRKILCAAVMRIKSPGIKFDNVLVLNGPQGIGKSTLISRLGGEWYSDSLTLTDMNDKTAAEKLQGSWIMEIGELAGMRKADIDRVKAFITRQDDKYRASFARRVTPHPRQCIFFGTTNAEGFLRDVTGNRRFWTVRTPGSDRKKPWELTTKDIAQLWAEVLTFVEKGEALFLDHDIEKEAANEQRLAMESDDREGIVRAYLDTPLPEHWGSYNLLQRRDYLEAAMESLPEYGALSPRTEVCNMEIWCECFGRRKEEMRRTDSFEISAIMAKIGGWEKQETGKTIAYYGKQRFYVREEQPADKNSCSIACSAACSTQNP